MVVYGRIDVYWPKGLVESFPLDKPAIAVGRSTGNDIILDNTTISRYHVAFTFKNQHMQIEDLQSVNGTYIDGARLQADKPYVLHGGEEIQLGEILIIFHPAEQAAPVSANQNCPSTPYESCSCPSSPSVSI